MILGLSILVDYLIFYYVDFYLDETYCDDGIFDLNFDCYLLLDVLSAVTNYFFSYWVFCRLTFELASGFNF